MPWKRLKSDSLQILLTKVDGFDLVETTAKQSRNRKICMQICGAFYDTKV